MLLSARRILYRIANPQIIHDKTALKNDTRLPFYPMYGRKQTKTGIMVLNKPDNNNNITRECADELYRFLSSYHHDHTVENVWIQNKGPSFSGGADYEELLRNPEYLDRLMRLAIRVGEFNKPIFAKVFGSVRGIGAYLLPMFSTPMGTDKSSLRLDETAKGFIPIFGGSHRLSKLPCNTGLYLALTGDKLSGEEMGRLGFLRGKVRDEHTSKQIHRHLSNANLFNRHPYGPSSISSSEIRRENVIAYKKNYFNDLIAASQREIFTAGGNFHSKFALNLYRVAQTDYYNMLNPYNSFTEKNLFPNNYFQMRHDRPFNYLKEKGIVQQGKTHHNLLARLPVSKLIKVFNRDSVQGVLEELARDGSEWAKRTEQMIRQKDPLAVHLTFHLIKNAEKMSWVECLEEEYKIARRILEISQVKHIKTQSGKTLIGLKNPHSPKPLESLTPQLIQSFFRPPQSETEIFDHDTPNHSFLPTSEYWRELPDAGRNYLNRTFFEDKHAKFGEIQVKRFLNNWKIDYRDASFSIPVLREFMYRKFQTERMVDRERQRIQGILQSEVFYSNLKQQRLKYMNETLKKPESQALITSLITQHFQHKFQTRFADLEKTAKIAGKESRMEIIRKYVSTLTENIVFKGREIEEKNRAHNVRHQGIVRIDELGQGRDVFTAENKIEKEIHELKILRNAYENDRNMAQLSKIDATKSKPEYMFTQNQFTDDEYTLVKQDAALRLNYNTTILPRQLAYKYRSLMQKAAETSQQISELLGWENADIESVIVNAPRKETTFREWAERTLESASKVQERVQALNLAYEAFQEYKRDYLPGAEANQGEEETVVKNLFFDTKMIPRPFRTVHLTLLDQVLNFYTQKYTQSPTSKTPKISNLPDSEPSSPLLTQWTAQGLNTNFTKLLKPDIEYTFSYLAMLHLKEMLYEITGLEPIQIEGVRELMRDRFGVEVGGMSYGQFSGMFMGYLYAILDMHQESKHRIIFPQTKMIEFLNCFQINASHEGYNFQALMLLIAKDRKMIRDFHSNLLPLLGYNPEINLNTLSTEQKQTNRAMPKLQEITHLTPDTVTNAIERMQELSTNKEADQLRGERRLVMGFNGYLRRFQAMVQIVAGSTMFLPKGLYQDQGKRTLELARELLRVEQSNEEWFNAKLKSAINSLLDFRHEQEKHMSEGQLKMFDEQFSQLFTPDLLALIIKYECYAEETVSRLLIRDGKTEPSTNDGIKSFYLDIKNQVKNPRALRMLNNLIMAENVVRERIAQVDETEYRKDRKVTVTSEQVRDLQPQKDKQIMARTYLRLASSAFRYADDADTLNPRNIKLSKTALGITDNEYTQQTTFIDELKEINKLIQENDLKAELEDRIRRVEAL